MKVLIVDDSIIFRKAIEKALSSIPGVAVIGSAWNGLKAMEFLKSLKTENLPDLITLDVEMPEMDGLQALREIQKLNHSLAGKKVIQVIMVSSLTKEGARVTLTALQQGALDFITKPDNPDTGVLQEILERKLREKIEGINQPVASDVHKISTRGVARSATKSSYRAIAIGVSTGGPKALTELLPPLCEVTSLPILIVQHMPKEFTHSLAENLNRYTSHRVIEAKEKDLIEARTVYIAPGGRHMTVRFNSSGHQEIALNDNPPENGCIPSADVLFRSVASVYAEKAIGLVLTGMGNDGTKGLAAMKRAGSYNIAQDEESSVVWGMPGHAYKSGVVNEVVSLSDMPQKISKLIGG